MLNIQSLIQTVNQFSSNPTQLLQRFGIPQSCNTPESVAQYLMNNGKVTQEQVNQANSLYKQLFKR